MTEEHRLMDEVNDPSYGQNERPPQEYQMHIEKIMNFQAITQTENSELAARYLAQNDWDESKAAKEYYDVLNRQDFVAVSINIEYLKLLYHVI